MSIPRSTLTNVVALALAEDLGSGDITTAACVSADAQARAELRARETLVFCGVDLVREVFRQVDTDVEVKALVADGARMQAPQVALTLSGPAASILQGERVALNFAQRMSAIASKTRAFVDALPAGSRTRITDTRKTTPGLRALERHAVRAGGGYNHRENLSAAVLIKDNHIAAAGGVAKAIAAARAHAPHTSRITCEVGDLRELAEALSARVDVVMLDNFADSALPEAVAMIAGRALIEVSGRVTLERIPVIAKAGVDVISIGGITHSAGAVDLGLDFVP